MLEPIFGINLGAFPIYKIMVVIGFFAALLRINKEMKIQYFSKYVKGCVRKSFFFAALIGLAGANIANWFLFENGMSYSLYERVTQGGFTFYFGMLCFFVASALFLRMYKLNVKHCINLVIPAFLLAHFFGRLGCSLRGCCFGEEVSLFGLTFNIPVREIEAVFLLVLFFVLAKRHYINRFKIYIFSYSAFRFLAEFFRGDERGSVLGIPFLSPTQIAALIVIIISAFICFTAPVLNLCGASEFVNKFKEKKKAVLQSVNNFFTKKKNRPYSSRSFTFTPQRIRGRAIKIILSILLIFTILIGSVLYANPFGISGIETMKYSLKDTFSFVYATKGVEDEIGSANGVSLLDISELGTIKSKTDALAAVKKYDNWTNLDYACTQTKTLSNGNRLYVFNQVVDKKPVLGKTRVLVTDKNEQALYIAGDASTATFTVKKVNTNRPDMPTVTQAFGKDVTVLEKKDYWFDTGEGLVDSYHAVLTDDGKTPVLGAVIDKSTGKIISLTEPQCGILSTQESNNIGMATDNVLELLKDNNTDELKKLSKNKKPSELAESRKNIEEALSKAFKKSKLNAEEFATIIESADEVATNVPNLNENIYREIVVEETRRTLINNGSDPDEAEKCAQKVEKAFKSADINQTDDEVVTTLTASESKTKFKHAIDFENDTDLFNVKSEENHSLDITVSAEEPVQVEVYDKTGKAVTSMYVEDEETLPIFAEEGNEFFVRVTDRNNSLAPISSPSKYSISLKSTLDEDKIPPSASLTLTTLKSSYNTSNLALVAGMISIDGQTLTTEEAAAVSVLPMLMDSCGSCVGMQEELDTAKTVLAGLFVPNFENYPELTMLRGSEMQLEHFRHVEKDGVLYLKARLIITRDGLELYNGFTFLKLENVKQVTTTEENSKFLEIFGQPYHITDANSDYLYSVFGDTANSISSTSELQSLYQYVKSKPIKVGDTTVYISEVDEQAALKEHSAEKVNSLKKYITRRNITTLSSHKAALEISAATLEGISTIGGTAYDIYGAVTDPFGTLAEAVFSQNEFTNNIWNAASFLASPTGYVTDVVIDSAIEASGEAADAIEEYIPPFDAAINDCYKELESLNAAA